MLFAHHYIKAIMTGAIAMFLARVCKCSRITCGCQSIVLLTYITGVTIGVVRKIVKEFHA